MAAPGAQVAAYLDTDPRFRGCSFVAKFLYMQIARAGRIVAAPGQDLVGTLVFTLRGLSDNPRADVTAALTEWERAGLVTREEEHAIRTAHERPPRPEQVEIPEEWSDRQREAWERRLRRARHGGGRVDVRALLERFTAEYAARGATVSADVSAPASGHDRGQRPRRTTDRTPSDVRPAVTADAAHGLSPSPSPRMKSLEEEGEEETSETSPVIARAAATPESVADTFDGQTADNLRGDDHPAPTKPVPPIPGQRYFDALVQAGPEALDPVQASAADIFYLGTLANGIGEPVSTYELVAEHWRQGGVREVFGWVEEVARGEPVPIGLLLSNDGKQLRLALSAARAWGRRTNAAAASTTPLADLFCTRAQVGLARAAEGERSALEAALARRAATVAEVSAMGMLCARGELGPQTTIRRLVVPPGAGEPALLDQWLEKTRRAIKHAAQRPGPAATSPPAPPARSRSG